MNSADQPKVIPLWPDGAPGSQDWTQQEQETVLPPPDSFKVVHNVTEPTLTAFLPNPSVASGTAIIVCPGGAFHMLAIDHEGLDVAHWLSQAVAKTVEYAKSKMGEQAWNEGMNPQKAEVELIENPYTYTDRERAKAGQQQE